MRSNTSVQGGVVADHLRRQTAINIRLACFDISAERSRWPALVAGWLKGAKPGSKFEDLETVSLGVLLDRHVLTVAQLQQVADALSRDLQDLLYDDRLDRNPGWVVAQNLCRLLPGHGRERLTAVAQELQVSPSTISRWKSGKQLPDRKMQQRLCAYLQLSAGADLARSPIFLSYAPVNHAERKAWISSQIELISATELATLFPAIQRLLSFGS